MLTIEYWFKGRRLQSAVRLQSPTVTAWVVSGHGAPTQVNNLVNPGTVNASARVDSAVPVNDELWHHVALTWQRGAASGLRSYLDGVVRGLANTDAAPFPVIDAPIWFGSFNGTSEFMDGVIDEVRIWKRVLPASEIERHARDVRRLSGEESGLVAYFNFNDKDAAGPLEVISGKRGTFNNMGAAAYVPTELVYGEPLPDPKAAAGLWLGSVLLRLMAALAVMLSGVGHAAQTYLKDLAKVLKTTLLANDSDADLDPLTLTAVGNALPAGATVAIAGNFVVYTAPAIVLDNLGIDEGSTEVISLRAIDSDTPPDQLVYTVLEEPVGARLQLLFGATARGTNGLFGDRWLKSGETFTQSDVNAGRLVISHEDPAAKSVSYKLRLSDGAVGRVPRESVLTMAVHPPTALDGTGAAIWMSSRFESGSTLSRWADASGPKPWLDGTEAALDANAVSTPLAVVPQGPLGQPVLSFNPTGSNAGQALALPTPEKATVFPPGEMTVLAVMKPTGHGETAQQVVAGPHFQLGLTGPEDNGRDQQLRFAAEGTGVIYGNHRMRDRWAVVSAWRENDQLGIEVNGSGVGGPHPLDPPTVFGTAPVLGARSDGGQIDQAYEGFLCEILVFNRSLDDQERHRIAYSLMGKWFGWVLLDGSDEARDLRWRVPSSGLTRAQYENDFIPKYGPDRNYIILGGWGFDTLEGGQNDDILVGGRQADVFTGGAGSDLFVFNFAHINHGADIIQDFRPVVDHDIINLAGLLRGEERDLRRYLRLKTDGHSSRLDIDFNGNAQYTNHTIHLKNVVLRDADLASLWANGNLLTGDKRIPLNVSLKTTTAVATEITDSPAVFAVHFDGTTVPVDLEMPFELSGSAVRNVDYTLSMQRYDAALQDYVWEPVVDHEFFVRVKPGDYDFEVRIEPIHNSRSQSARSVQMRLTPVPEWFDVTTATAVAQIVDGPQRVGVASTDKEASEAGDAGVLMLVRDGSLDIPLDVTVRMTGPAVNGVDYAYVPRLVQFQPGQSRVAIEITPYADNEREFPEVAELIVEPGSEYFVDTASQAAAVVIQDSGPIITVEAIEPLAVVKDGSPGAFLLHRRGMINETLVVSLEIGGTATMNLDYQRVNRFVTFGPGANSVLVTVQPLATATLRGDLETVDLRVLPATGYEVGVTALAQVRLVPEYATFVQWKARHFPGNATPVGLFAEQDADNDGVRHLLEYAHGLNPLAADAGSSNLPHPVVIGGRFGVQFSRPAAALDLDFIPEISTDLKSWVPAKDSFDMYGEPLQDFGMESVTFLERTPMNSAVFRFVRVRAALQ